MIIPSQLALKTTQILCVPQPRNVRQTSRQISTTASIGDTSLTHVMRLAAHSITSPTPTAMGQSFIITLLFLVLVK
jgi:hypothetical protein